MTSHLADSDVVIDFLKGRQPMASAIADLIRAESLALSAITLGEVYEGALQADDAEFSREVEDLFDILPIIMIDKEIAGTYARLRSNLRSTGNLIPDNDLWIAAAALRRDVTLISRDAHFDRVAGLKLLRPS